MHVSFIFKLNLFLSFQMSSNDAYEKAYSIIKAGPKNNQLVWDQTYDYIKKNPEDLFRIAGKRIWTIAHQIVYHGGLSLFKSLLELYTEDTINIFVPTKDSPTPKTILDIASERKAYYKEQFEYIERLFLQDKFLRACKDLNWPIIDDMLDKDKTLLNEKPPYYPKYLLHYLVEFGDPRRLNQYNFPDHPFQFGLKNSNDQTALQLARQINNDAMVEEIQQVLASEEPATAKKESAEKKEEPATVKEEHVTVRKKSAEKKEEPKPIPPICRTKSISDEALKLLICPITKKIFVDPVLAGDGCTYERKALIKHLMASRFSPSTNEAMDDSITENVLIKEIIDDFRKSNIIPK